MRSPSNLSVRYDSSQSSAGIIVAKIPDEQHSHFDLIG